MKWVEQSNQYPLYSWHNCSECFGFITNLWKQKFLYTTLFFYLILDFFLCSTIIDSSPLVSWSFYFSHCLFSLFIFTFPKQLFQFTHSFVKHPNSHKKSVGNQLKLYDIVKGGFLHKSALDSRKVEDINVEQNDTKWS